MLRPGLGAEPHHVVHVLLHLALVVAVILERGDVVCYLGVVLGILLALCSHSVPVLLLLRFLIVNLLPPVLLTSAGLVAPELDGSLPTPLFLLAPLVLLAHSVCMKALRVRQVPRAAVYAGSQPGRCAGRIFPLHSSLMAHSLHYPVLLQGHLIVQRPPLLSGSRSDAPESEGRGLDFMHIIFHCETADFTTVSIEYTKQNITASEAST
mmetsp:Transcript_4170/g.7074  ORF Transcript_4170/g.7074 Transcript_4170/m.7074 type:complete len:209 (-) Transcript_4170:60-686(-)